MKCTRYRVRGSIRCRLPCRPNSGPRYSCRPCPPTHEQAQHVRQAVMDDRAFPRVLAARALVMVAHEIVARHAFVVPTRTRVVATRESRPWHPQPSCQRGHVTGVGQGQSILPMPWDCRPRPRRTLVAFCCPDPPSDMIPPACPILGCLRVCVAQLSVRSSRHDLLGLRWHFPEVG